MNLHHGLATTAAAVALAISAAPTVAQAAPPDVQVHYSDVYDVLLPDPSDPAGSFCGGLTNVPLHVEIDGYFSIKDHGPNAPSPYFADRYRSTLVYTNPQTQLTYTVVRVRQSKDLRIVDNGDGTLDPDRAEHRLPVGLRSRRGAPGPAERPDAGDRPGRHTRNARPERRRIHFPR